MPSQIKLPQSTVIVTHELFYGASQAMRDWLVTQQIPTLLFISHPIRPENPHSYMQLYTSGKLVYQQKTSRKFSLWLWRYLSDTVLSFWWFWRAGRQYDLYIGVDPLNCLVGLVLKRFGIVKRVVFYAIDFVPRRFSSKPLDKIYHWLETWCIKNSDERWNVSPRMAIGRKKFLGISPQEYLQKVVPIGVWKKDIKIKPLSKSKKHWLVFAGHLLDKQGLQMVIKSLPAIISLYPDTHLLVIGGGEYEDKLKELVKKLHLLKAVTFTGWISDQNKILKLLRSCALALATYDPQGENNSNFTYYADPTKVKTYLSCGLPVIMTRVSYNAEELEKAGCARLTEYDVSSVQKAILYFWEDDSHLMVARKNTILMAKKFTWETIFTQVFSYTNN